MARILDFVRRPAAPAHVDGTGLAEMLATARRLAAEGIGATAGA